MSTVSFPGLGFAVNVKEIAFRIFNWPIHWYGIIIAAGFLLAVYYCCRKAADYGIEQDDIIDLLIFAVPLCIIGARLYYVIFYLDLYRNPDGSLDFLRMLRIWDGGLAIYGGIIVAILTLLVFCKIKKIPFLAFADVGSFGMLIGQLVGRWGNFVNVEAYGAPTDLPWRMGIYDTVNGVYQYMEVHPTFLYESLWNLVGFLLLALVVAKHRKFDGQIFLGYIAWYGLGRAWIEGLRTDSLYFFSTGLRVSQILALISFVLALAVMIVQLRRKHDPKELWVNQVKARKAAATGAEEGSAIMGEPEDLTQEEPEEKEENTDDPA
ncbi:prolipoprotein diacylglyceryl transferase [Pseudoflavonifractor phocaeensis]|uniref:prolipoprotein diacylglyceryl transferase n=1 Tax=Pseudoflavonifractor phocaeensis TaxID=1870988 RepID=UPI00313E6B12